MNKNDLIFRLTILTILTISTAKILEIPMSNTVCMIEQPHFGINEFLLDIQSNITKYNTKCTSISKFNSSTCNYFNRYLIRYDWYGCTSC